MGYKQSKRTYFEYFQSEPKNISLFQLPKVENRKFNINADVLENLDVLQELNQKIKAAEFSYKSDKSTKYGSFDLQAGYQNSDTNLLSPQEQSSLMLAYNIDIFTGFQRSSQIAQSLFKLNSLKLEKE